MSFLTSGTIGLMAASLLVTFVVRSTTVSGAIARTSVAVFTRYVASSRPVIFTPSRAIRSACAARAISVTSFAAESLAP